MIKRPTRRDILASFAAMGGTSVTSASLVWADAPPHSLRPLLRPEDLGQIKEPRIEELIRGSGLSGAQGVVVLDAKTGDVLEEISADLPLPPASVAKAITALYALDTLRPSYRFTTRLLLHGSVRHGIITGDVILAGGGDPVLGTDDLAALAKQLKTAGITEVRGNFYVWGGVFPFTPKIDFSQPDHVAYNPSVSGLNLNFNRVNFEWKRQAKGWEISMDARSSRYRIDVSIAQMKIEDRRAPLFKHSDLDGRDHWSVAAAHLGKGGARWLPMRKPELYAGEVFQTFAAAQGITLPAARALQHLPSMTRELARHDSAPVTDIIRGMLKYSTNLTAEALGLAATTARQGAALSLEASAHAMTIWAQNHLGMSRETQFWDHSGLSGASRVCALDMAKALHHAQAAPHIRKLLSHIKIKDDQRRVIKDHPVTVVAKTGTLNFVSGLAGYARIKDQRDLIFAMFFADTDRRDRLKKSERESPPGGRSFNAASKVLQQRFLRRWGRLFSEA